MKLVLASSSPRRKELLGHLGVPFEVLTRSVLEESDETSPAEFSREIALKKGKIISDAWKGNALIVSADTVVALGGRIYGKPTDVRDAEQILGELAGKTHSVFTAVVTHLHFRETVSVHSFVEESRVTFNPIPPELMKRYLATGDSLDKAGAYGIQGPSLTFISKVDGDYANVVGFPLSRFVVECSRLLSPPPGKSSWLDLF